MPSNLHFQKAPQLVLISLISDDLHEAQQSELLAQSLKGGQQASRQASFFTRLQFTKLEKGDDTYSTLCAFPWLCDRALPVNVTG